MLEEERILEHMKTPITRRIRIRKYENADTDKNEILILISFETLLSPRREMSEEMSVSPVALAEVALH